MKTQPKIYAIRDKLTGEYCVFGSKCAWVSTGAAKNAFQLHVGEYEDVPCKWSRGGYRRDFIHAKYDEQTQYEMVEI